ncbi:MAG: hypothetical protein LBM73_01430 [Candidatus Nomurabacteria bacterium]|jgi:hypothetical protein|nr:hypothetical protein [Candidatus Nomurabacteria bacterium]
MKIRAKISFKNVALLVVVAVIALGGLATGLVKFRPAHAALNYNNANVVDVMLGYLGRNGGEICRAAGRSLSYYGECKQTVNCALSIASGGRQYPVSGGSDYNASFRNAGGVEVSSGAAVKGDVIVVQSFPHVAVVVKNLGGGRFDVVDSNYGYDHIVREHIWQPSGARFWRMGMAASQASFGGVGGLISDRTDRFMPGRTLQPGHFIDSADGVFVLVMQGDGNLVLYSGSSALWSSGTAGNPGAYFIFQGDGNGVIYKSDRRTPIWATGTVNNGTNLFVVQDDGNIVSYSSHGATWSSNSYRGGNGRNYFGSNRLLAGQGMSNGQYLRSSDWRYTAVMQSDGNLVVYAAGGRPVWSSNTAPRVGSVIWMQNDNNLVIYDRGGAVWSSNTFGTGMSSLLMQDDGNLVGYTNYGAAKWASNTVGRF